jgi:hypothetical protein
MLVVARDGLVSLRHLFDPGPRRKRIDGESQLVERNLTLAESLGELDEGHVGRLNCLLHHLDENRRFGRVTVQRVADIIPDQLIADPPEVNAAVTIGESQPSKTSLLELSAGLGNLAAVGGADCRGRKPSIVQRLP